MTRRRRGPAGCPNFTLTRKCNKIVIVNLTGSDRIIQLVHNKYGVEFVKIKPNATSFCYDFEKFEEHNQTLPEIPNFNSTEQISASWRDPGCEIVKLSSNKYNVFEIRKKAKEPRSLWNTCLSKIFSTSRLFSQVHQLPPKFHKQFIILERPVSFHLPALIWSPDLVVPPLIQGRCPTCFCEPW